MRRPWLRAILIIAVSAFLSVFSAFVWPTAWRDRLVTLPSGSITARQHRFTGAVQVLCPDGWHLLTEDPFADLAPPNRTSAEKINPCLNAPLAELPDRYRR